MRKVLILAGKSLVILSMLFPIPLGFLVQFGEYAIGEEPYQYWLPLLLVMAIGILLCAIGSRKMSYSERQEGFLAGQEIIRYFFKTIKWILIVIGCLYLIGLVIVGLWHLFYFGGWEFSMMLFGIGLPVGVAIYYGWEAYKNYHSKNKNK